MQIRLEVFCAKLLTERQTNKQRQLHILLGGGNKNSRTNPENKMEGAYLNIPVFLLTNLFWSYSRPGWVNKTEPVGEI